MRDPEYYIYGVFPVKFRPSSEGGMAVLKLNPDTGLFEHDITLYDRIHYARDGVAELSADEFIQHVEALRARNLTGDGPVFALYSLINGIEDVAREEGRELTSDESALIAELRRESYAAFQAANPDPE